MDPGQVQQATNSADAQAAEAVRRHHASMAGTLADLVRAFVGAVGAGAGVEADRAWRALVSWCDAELVPHAMAEEQAMYPAAQAMPAGRLLVTGMLAEHVVIGGLVGEVADTADPVAAAAAARALQVLFEVHLGKENDLVLPLLVAAPDVSVAELLGGMHELLGGDGGSHEHGAHSTHGAG